MGINEAKSGLSPEGTTSGFRVLYRHAIRELSGYRETLFNNRYVGVLFRQQSQGFRIMDVQVKMGRRQKGKKRAFNS